jgi:hypothetical protein
MITDVYYKPHVYTGAYNPIVWSFKSDQSEQLDFTYVVDIYINGATGTVYRLKQRPNPFGVGMVDVSPIIQPFVDYSDFAAEQGWSDNYRNSEDILADVYIKVGEEYSTGITGAPLVMYNGQGALGNPSYTIYALEGSTNAVNALPMALPYEEAMNNMASTGNYGTLSDYVMCAGEDKLFLSRWNGANGNNPISVRSNDRHTLTFLNWDYFAGGSYASPVQAMVIDQFGATGALGQLVIQNTISAGGGPQVTTNYTTATNARQSRMLTFPCGPVDLSLNPNTTFYYVSAWYKDSATTSTTPQAQTSEYVRFNIENPCLTLYPNVRLSWLNDLGGRDYYNFDMFFEQTNNSKGESYNQTPLNWSGFTPVSTDQDTNTYQNWLRGGAKSFNKVVSRKFKIESNWITQDVLDYLGGIPESPSVWAYIGDEPVPYTITIDNVNYTYKNIKQVKLAQASFDCTITKTQQKQNM